MLNSDRTASIANIEAMVSHECRYSQISNIFSSHKKGAGAAKLVAQR